MKIQKITHRPRLRTRESLRRSRRVVPVPLIFLSLAILALSIYGLVSSINTVIARIEYKPTPIAVDGQPIDTMQEMTPVICDSMDLYSSLKLRDDRGTTPQYYRVRKMPDNRCWMIDNLKLELTTGVQLTTTNSNVTSDIIIPATAPKTSGDLGYDVWGWADPSNTDSCAAGIMIDPASTTGCGYLYNWYTATASSGTLATESSYVTNSICPKGWHLPRGNDGMLVQNEFAVLNSAMYDGSKSGMGYTEDAKYVQNWRYTGMFSGVLSGAFYLGFVNQNIGYFWSSSADSKIELAWGLYIHHNYVRPGTSQHTKYDGFAVRCVS